MVGGELPPTEISNALAFGLDFDTFLRCALGFGVQTTPRGNGSANLVDCASALLRLRARTYQPTDTWLLGGCEYINLGGGIVVGRMIGQRRVPVSSGDETDCPLADWGA
jgi:hypothetical protein